MAKKRKKRDDIWITKDGRRIPIKEMTTMHIMRAIDFFEKAGGREKQVELLKIERAKRLGIIEEPVESRFDILDFRKD